MSASKYDPRKLKLPLFGQPKLNGLRAYMKWDKERKHITIASKTNVIYENKVLPHLVKIMGNIPTNIILDGELYVHGWPLQRIMGAVNRKTPNEDSAKVQFHVFDCLLRGNKQSSFAERLTQIRLLNLPLVSSVYIVYTINLESLDEVDHFHYSCISRGYEGSMLRCGDNTYLQGARSNALMKRKDFLDEDCKILGVKEGEGKYKGTTGAFECEFPNKATFTVGSGLTDKDRDEIWKHRENIKGVVKVKYETLSEKGIPLKPIVLGYELS